MTWSIPTSPRMRLPVLPANQRLPRRELPATDFPGQRRIARQRVPLPTNPQAALGPISSYTFGGKRPYGLTWNFGIQHVFKKNYTFEARYVGTRGVHLWNQTRLNIDPLVSANNYIPTFFSMPSAFHFVSLTKTLGL